MKIVTHNGRFHHDEITATVILKKIYPDCEVIRTRDEQVISTGDIVYDVGRVFDPVRRRFDHHQRGFTETFSNKHTIKLSSAGLIFKYFSTELIGHYGFDVDDKMFEFVVDNIYEEFFLGIDGIDNGYSVNGAYSVRGVCDLVGSFNPITDDEELQNAKFAECMKIVETDMDNFMKHKLFDWFPQYKRAHELVRSSEGHTIVTRSYVSAKMVREVEILYGKDLKFIVIDRPGDVRVYAVPLNTTGFDSKVPLKQEWRGLDGEELVKLSGITSAVFVHASGFLGCCRTVEDAWKMCEETLRAARPAPSSGHPSDSSFS